MKQYAIKFIEWYFNTNTSKTPLQRLFKAILFLPSITIGFILGLSYLISIHVITILWAFFAALPYWICTNSYAPKFIETHILNPVKEIHKNF